MTDPSSVQRIRRHSSSALFFEISTIRVVSLSMIDRRCLSWSVNGLHDPCNFKFPFYPSTGAILLFLRFISICGCSGLPDWASGVELEIAGGLPILNKCQACLLTFCSFLFQAALISEFLIQCKRKISNPCSVFSTVKTYCETSPALERLSKPNNHVTPKRGNNTMQAFTVVLIKRNWLKLVIQFKS